MREIKFNGQAVTTYSLTEEERKADDHRSFEMFIQDVLRPAN